MKWQLGWNKQMVCCCNWIMDYYTSVLVTQILHQENSRFQTARKSYRLKINKWLQASLLVERWLILIRIYLLIHILTKPVLRKMIDVVSSDWNHASESVAPEHIFSFLCLSSSSFTVILVPLYSSLLFLPSCCYCSYQELEYKTKWQIILQINAFWFVGFFNTIKLWNLVCWVTYLQGLEKLVLPISSWCTNM